MAAVSVSTRLRPATSRSVAASVLDGGALSVHDKVYEGFLSSVVTGSDQGVAFDAIASPLLKQLHAGYSCTLLAYGQTGSGKTYTIFGPTGSLTEASLSGPLGPDGVPPAWGLFPRLAFALLKSGTGTLHASAVEIYAEHAYDLLADRAPLSVGSSKAGRNVGGGPTCMTSSGSGAVTQGPKGAKDDFHGVHPKSCRCGKCFLAQKAELAARLAKRDAAQGKGLATTASCAEHEVSTVGEVRVELKTAADIAKLARTVEVTRVAVGHNLNARSSRSHCFVHLHLTDKAVGINSSLTALGKVVRAVGEHSAHVPYRDSTLTQLLRSSLGGRSCTSVVIALASDAEHADETACSLEFGRRMAVVRNQATVVVGREVAAEARGAVSSLEAARAALARLEAEGHGERFGEAADGTSVASFQENARRKALYDTEALEAKGELTEAVASGAGGRVEKALRTRIAAAEAESDNLRDILLRQKSIKGFWIAPKASYTKKLAEVRELEARVAMLGLDD